jgi:general secretion pathway protein G
MKDDGITLLEVLITITILGVLASISLPLAKYGNKRSQELELRHLLRDLRTAIDDFRRDWNRDGEQLLGPLCIKNKSACKEHTGVTGYPKSLKTLLGVELTGAEASIRETIPVRRYLRRIPLDPITASGEWGLRCYQDPPETQDWCKEDVFDVFSKSDQEALDKTKYRDW